MGRPIVVINSDGERTQAIDRDDYHSHNTRRLHTDQMCELLLLIAKVRADLGLPQLGEA
jgi:isopentenyldiphosphate isomerase